MNIKYIMFYLCAGMCCCTTLEKSFCLDKKDEKTSHKNTPQITIPENPININLNANLATTLTKKKPTVGRKLEMIYLMNVALYLESTKDIRNFASMSKKAQEACIALHINPVSIKPHQVNQYPKLATLHLRTYNDVSNWSKTGTKVDKKLHRIDVWPAYDYAKAVQLRKKLCKFVSKPEMIGAITFHNIAMNRGDNVGTIDNEQNFIFNQNIHKNKEQTAKNVDYILKSISPRAFYQTNEIKSIVIPDTVSYINRSAIGHLSNLTSIKLPNNLSCVERHMIHNCEQLKEIVIPTSVSGISSFGIFNCSSLSKITIPNSVLGLGHCPVQNCDACTVIVANTKMQNLLEQQEFTNEITVDQALNQRLFNWAWQDTQHLEIPTIVTKITDYNFIDRTDLKSVAIPTTVKSIDDSAFLNCNELTNIKIPDSITYIGDRVFKNCKSLTGITSLGKIKSIHYQTFDSCTSLSEINLPTTLTSIMWQSFRACSKLTRIKIPDNVSLIEDAFGIDLKNITLPKKLQRSYQTYDTCKLELNEIEEVTIPLNLFYQINVIDLIKYNRNLHTVNITYNETGNMINTFLPIINCLQRLNNKITIKFIYTGNSSSH